MNAVIIISTVIVSIAGQRPFYAGTSVKGYPELASRFQETNDNQNITINDRLGAGDEQTSQNVPTESNNKFYERVSEWPRENQPFWLINAGHIEKHLRPNVNGQRPNSSQATNSGDQRNELQSRFGEPVATETRTIKPLSQRGSFAGSGTRT
ncbi:uncharacterized protein LOC115887149 [Sitophilus oryzae]|uniref:Uncharacterized protein LOC115887149 n=1 Tax=Sitophilus oryzae TaxID=7048 RepID=A0A6J2YGW7_SITOR|nr:uncharacterized protein LOC115887149 [Sitophilus oryzae]